MNGATRLKIAGAQLKRLDPKRRRLEVAMALEKLKGCARGRTISDPTKSHVRMKKADIERQS
jgi:hypothetical protein